MPGKSCMAVSPSCTTPGELHHGQIPLSASTLPAPCGSSPQGTEVTLSFPALHVLLVSTFV